MNLVRILTVGLCLLAGSPVAASDFFEKRVRPVLATHCFPCHGATKQKAGLRLDHITFIKAGGERGPVIIPGNPRESRLIEAIHYENVDLQMPPPGKLPKRAIDDLTRWIERGAPWPDEPLPSAAPAADAFDLEARRRSHWAWTTLAAVEPPASDLQSWARTDADHFIAARLDQGGLRPAPAADKRTLLRRVYFDLIGLPPPPDALRAFLADDSAEAFTRVVDELLDSPHFGERWGRHWLDLVRYAETYGHEFDFPIHGAWHYRDYVIRALNADVPYDQFVREHIAGDLLEDPRRHDTEGFNESIIGTAFYWLGQQTHSPVDVRAHQADTIDNQIDVLTKAFLGLTVSCARCHDHKFDAISIRDYYALYGVIASSRYGQRAIDPLAPSLETAMKLREEKKNVRRILADAWFEELRDVEDYLLAAYEGKDEETVSLDPTRLTRWRQLFQSPAAREVGQPLRAWFSDDESSPAGMDSASHHTFDKFEDLDPTRWYRDGHAFELARPGDFLLGEADRVVPALLQEAWVHSALASRRLEGVLRSRTFEIEKPYIHIRAMGRGSRINVVLENFVVIRDPIYGGLKRRLDSDRPEWLSIDVGMWIGRRAYIELSDIAVGDPGTEDSYDENGYLAVEHVLFSSDELPPNPAHPAFGELFGETTTNSPAALARRYGKALREAVRAWGRSDLDNSPRGKAQAAVLDWLLQKKILPTVRWGLSGVTKRRLALVLGPYHGLEKSLSTPRRVPAMMDGNGLDERVFLRGDSKSPGEPVPRRFLTAICGAEQAPIKDGSGRRELAERMTSSASPLLARVLVNRVWHHLFGRGLVRTTDNFGALGASPSHPELLDFLARSFRDDAGWSVKKLVRLLVLSSTYQMSSDVTDATAEEKDPDNVLYHRMRIKRLDGEALRDAVLAVSGELKPELFGPPTKVHLTRFMQGRGRPPSSGPLDGEARRSVYLEMRRNFLSPWMLTFDTPIPFTTAGNRGVSNVPAQALILMNDPFVAAQARRWAQRSLRSSCNAPQRVALMYRTALARPPLAAEIEQALDFLQAQSGARSLEPEDIEANEDLWTDFAHVVFNLKEFSFIR